MVLPLVLRQLSPKTLTSVIDSFDNDALTGDDDFGFNEIVTFAEDV